MPGTGVDSLTLTLGHTRPGLILGTAAYMSPEQAMGKPADRRSDIFSFGVVLFEMLTGQRAFAGETAGETLVSVAKDDPDWSKLPARLPGAVQKLLRRCLVKDRKKRLQAIGEARIVLEEVQSGGSDEGPAAPMPTPLPSRLGSAGWIAAGVAILIAAGATSIAFRAMRPAELKPLMRLDMDLGSDVNLDYGSGTSVILSPDGTRLAFISQGRLFTRSLDQASAKELVGPEGVTSPFFSPDGRWIGFFAQGKMKKVSVTGGTPIELAPSSGSYTGAAWGEDGNIIAPLGAGNPLMRIPEAGGTPIPIMKFAEKEASQRWPQFLPGGKAILFVSHTASSAFDNANIEVVTLADGRRKTLQRGGTYGRYVPTFGNTGHLLYVNRRTLFAVLFDPESLEITGTPTPIIDPLAYSSAFGYAEFSVSRIGTVVHRSGGDNAGAIPQWLDSSGNVRPLLSRLGNYAWVRLSPDGARLAAVLAEGSNPRSIWSYDWARDTMTRLTFEANNPGNPTWTPDGRFVVYAANGIYATRSDGAGTPTRLIPSGLPGSFTPDGKRLAYSLTNVSAGTRADLWTVPVEYTGSTLKAGKPEPFLQTPANEFDPAFSPDGRWLAYASDESGVSQLYVRAFPDNGGKWQISNTSGILPVWSRVKHELLFRTVDDQVMVANYTTRGDSFVSERPHVWTEQHLTSVTGINRNFDLAPDGKRIVALLTTNEDAEHRRQNQVIYLENFFDELRRKVPVGK